MSKKIEQMEKEVTSCKENIKKLNDRIKELNKKISDEKRQIELANNKLIADAVRKVYGDVTEENIENFMELLKQNGHTINGVSNR